MYSSLMRISTLFLFCAFGIGLECTAFVQPMSVRKDYQTEFRRNKNNNIHRFSNNGDDDKVNVNLIDNVDSFTLTAVGFGLIAFNFFVLANLGDAGLAGVIARIINTFG